MPYIKTKMIKIDDIEKIVKLVLSSGFIKNSDPLSLILVGKAGVGKTCIITGHNTKKSIVTTDLSKFGLIRELKEKPNLSHIVIPDFIKVTDKKQSTRKDLISTLNSATEEGLNNLSLYQSAGKFKNKKIGIITSTTKASYSQNKKAWVNIGFVSRMLIVSYDYSEKTRDEILNYIENEKYSSTKAQNIKGLKERKVETPFELNKQLEEYSKKEFRTQKQLQTLAKANALYNQRNKVIQEDIDEIIRLTKYMNENFTKI